MNSVKFTGLFANPARNTPRRTSQTGVFPGIVRATTYNYVTFCAAKDDKPLRAGQYAFITGLALIIIDNGQPLRRHSYGAKWTGLNAASKT